VHEGVCDLFGEAETDAFISRAIALLAKADAYLEIGYHIYRIRTYLVHQWLRFSRSPVFQTGSRLDSRVSSISRGVQNKISAKLSDWMLRLEAWSMKIFVVSTLRDNLNRQDKVSPPPPNEGVKQRDKNEESKEKEDKNSAQRQRAAAVASRQKAQTELLKRGILQMSALLAFTILFFLLVRFRGQRLGQQQQQ
jgi:hypothetical protein